MNGAHRRRQRVQPGQRRLVRDAVGRLPVRPRSRHLGQQGRRRARVVGQRSGVQFEGHRDPGGGGAVDHPPGAVDDRRPRSRVQSGRRPVARPDADPGCAQGMGGLHGRVDLSRVAHAGGEVAAVGGHGQPGPGREPPDPLGDGRGAHRDVHVPAPFHGEQAGVGGDRRDLHRGQGAQCDRAQSGDEHRLLLPDARCRASDAAQPPRWSCRSQRWRCRAGSTVDR